MKTLIMIFMACCYSLVVTAQLTDGVYPLAKVTISGGIITLIESGSEVDPVFLISPGAQLTNDDFNHLNLAYDRIREYPSYTNLDNYIQSVGVKTGVVQMYIGSTPPSGYLMCDGSAINRGTYSTLFAMIGTAYGPGNGTTTFNLPDMRQRFPMGVASSGTGSSLGATGGNIDHVHSVNPPNTTSGVPSSTNAAATPLLGSVPTVTHTHDTDIAAFNSASANPPFVTINFIIKY